MSITRCVNSKALCQLIAALLCVMITTTARSQALAPKPTPPQVREPALWMRLVDAPALWRHVIDLCRDSPFDSPAAAMAAAKSAGIQPKGGNKAFEAAISVFNKAILPELTIVDGMIVSLEPNFPQKRVDWRLGVPRDDGTADAFITAMALEDSQPAGQVAGLMLERLGENLMVARGQGQVYFGPGRDALEPALISGTDAFLRKLQPPVKTGLWLRADARQWPSALGRTVEERIALETLRRFAAGRPVEFRVFPWGESVQAECLDLFRAMPASPVQPRWLARWEVPLSGRLMAQASVGLDPRKPFWSQVFEIATEVERSLPGREKVANLRDRINIAALLARVSPETDLYPNLIGLTVGAVVPDAPVVPPTVVATLHARDVRATQILVEKLLVPVIRTIGGDPKGPGAAGLAPRGNDSIRGLAIVSNRPIFMFLEPPDIHLVWGARNVAEAAVAAVDRASNASTTPMLWFDRFAQSGPVHRAAAAYPEAVVRWRLMMGEQDTPWTQSAAGMPPLVWLGRSDKGESRDIAAFSGSRAYVQSLLSRIPPPQKPAE